MRTGGLIAFGIALAVGVVPLVWVWWPRRLAAFEPGRLQLLAAPRPGPAMVSGVVEARDALATAPLTGAPCVAYELAAFRVDPGSSNRGPVYVLCEHLRVGTRFVLRDGDATLDVDLRDGTFDLAQLEPTEQTLGVEEAAALGLAELRARTSGPELRPVWIWQRALPAGKAVTIDAHVDAAFADAARLELRGRPEARARVALGDHREARLTELARPDLRRRFVTGLAIFWLLATLTVRWAVAP